MKKSIIIFCIVLLIAAVPVFSDEVFVSRVAVAPIIEAQEDGGFESVCSAIQDTVLLTLHLLGDYDVIDKTTEEISHEDFQKTAEEESLDSIIYGSIYIEETGSVEISLSVWDRQKRSDMLEVKETAETVFDVFDTSDTIVVSLLEGFSGTHIAYGSIAFAPSGAEGNYSIYMNDKFAGYNKKDFRQVLTGEYLITVKQSRPFGELVLYSDTIAVEKGMTSSIEFEIPVITPDETQRLTGIDREIEQNWTNTESREKLKALAEETGAVLDRFPGESLSQLSGKYTRRLSNLEKKETVLFNYFEKEYSITALMDHFNEDSAPFTDIYDSFSTDASGPGDFFTLGSVSRLKNDFSDDIKEAILPRVANNSIRVDGQRNDWINIPVLLKDRAKDSIHEGADLQSVYCVRDDNKIYILINFHGNSLYAVQGAWHQIYLQLKDGNVNLHCGYWDEAWHANIYRWVRSEWKSYDRGKGTVSTGRNFLEASFPIDPLYEYIDPDKQYWYKAQGGTPSKMLDNTENSVPLSLN